MSDGGAVWIWATAILAVSVGFAVGFLVAYVAVLKDGNAAKLRQELDAQKAEFETYRGRVDDHFVRTSELFQDMTRQYGALYEHLAGGAQSLCSDRLVTHRPTVPESTPMVEHKLPERATPSAAEGEKNQSESDRMTAHEPMQHEPMQTEAAPEPEKPAASQPSDPEEAEMESLAPRPETVSLRESAATVPPGPDAGPDTPMPEDKRQLH